jgi:putative ABC transport system substrate-binding protein
MAIHIRRREFIFTLGGAAAAWTLAARAQQTMPVIGVLYGTSAAAWADRMVAFRRGLGETGFVEGRNVTIEYRWADGQLDRMPWMAADLISRRVAVILIGGNTSAVRDLLATTQTIPIVFTTGADPVAAGLVTSLNRPGGNATGATVVSAELGPKKLELLHEVVPAARKIAVLVNPNNRLVTEADTRMAQVASARLGLEVTIVNGGHENELETAFASAVHQGAGAVYLGADAVFSTRHKLIAALALRHRLPTIASNREAVRVGQLISYGATGDDDNMYRQTGVYVGRILKGEKPGDLPVVQPTKFDLVINLTTAKALGLTVPAQLLARADEVIE